MSAILAAIAALRAKGMSDTDILDVVEVMAAADANAPVNKPRSAAAIRQERYRNNRNKSVTSDACDVTVTDEQKKVLEPKKNIYNYPKALSEPLPQGAARRVRGHRLPDDWKPTAELHAYALAEGIPNHLIARIDADFIGYWRNATGPNSRKLDWGLAYQGWVRREADKVRPKAQDPPKRVWGSV